MTTVQVNIKLDKELADEVEELVRKGIFRSKKDAFTQALKLLIRKYRAEELRRIMDEIREGTEKMPSATEAIIRSHEEEDMVEGSG